jgi:hypothetical protein
VARFLANHTRKATAAFDERAGLPTPSMTRLKALLDTPNAIELSAAELDFIVENEIVCSNVDSAASTQSKRANELSLTRGTDSPFTRSVHRRQKAAPPARSHLNQTGLIKERSSNQPTCAQGRQPPDARRIDGFAIATQWRRFSLNSPSKLASSLNLQPDSRKTSAAAIAACQVPPLPLHLEHGCSSSVLSLFDVMVRPRICPLRLASQLCDRSSLKPGLPRFVRRV